MTRPMISIERLSKSFGRLQVLNEVSFDAGPSAVTAILGPNASGKSTLIKCVLGLVNVDSGEILVNGKPIRKRWDYRRLIGYMPQLARFPENLKVKELFQMLIDLRRGHRRLDEELISHFGLHEFYDRPLRVLSGGTRQKINASIAFLFSPEVLILDEPTAGLDPIAIAILKEKIEREKNSGKTILLTTHNMHEVDEMADRILFLLEGKTFFDGSINTLKAETDQARVEGAIVSLMGGSS